VIACDLLERGRQVIRVGCEQDLTHFLWKRQQRLVRIGEAEMAVLACRDEPLEISDVVRQ